jgi:hypothetical protein
MADTLVAAVGGGVTLARTLFVESHDWPHDRTQGGFDTMFTLARTLFVESHDWPHYWTQGGFDTMFTLARILFADDGGWWVYVRAGAQLQRR